MTRTSPERPVLQSVLLDVGGHPDVRLWRQNSGSAVSVDGLRAIALAPPGASDLVGLASIPCHCDCGRRYGVHLAVETKSARGRQRDAQIDFQRAIEFRGGIYVLARSSEDVFKALYQNKFPRS